MKKLGKKLKLKKKTISSLNEQELTEFQGGSYNNCECTIPGVSGCTYNTWTCPPDPPDPPRASGPGNRTSCIGGLPGTCQLNTLILSQRPCC